MKEVYGRVTNSEAEEDMIGTDDSIVVSVCMASYNGEKFILEQLESILAQLSASDEVVIVDDCSADSTRQIIESFRDRRIKLHLNSKNMGVIGTFERAISLSAGQFIFLSDQDDVWMPDRLSRTIAGLQDHKEKVMVCDAYLLFGTQVGLGTFYSERRSGTGLLKNMFFNSFIGCCMAFSADMKNYILPFPDQLTMHDQWIGLSGYIHGSVEFIPDRLLKYRRHEANLTDIRSFKLRQIIGKRLKVIGMLTHALARLKKQGGRTRQEQAV